VQAGPFGGVTLGAYILDGAFLVRNGTVQLVGIGALTVTKPDGPGVVMAGIGTLSANAQVQPNYGKPITLVAPRDPDDLTIGG